MSYAVCFSLSDFLHLSMKISRSIPVLSSSPFCSCPACPSPLIMEKSLKKNIYTYIYIDICLNHFAVHLKLTQHCKSPILHYI